MKFVLNFMCENHHHYLTYIHTYFTYPTFVPRKVNMKQVTNIQMTCTGFIRGRIHMRKYIKQYKNN